MYGALLGMVFVLPYSFALIETCQIIMMLAWGLKRFFLCKSSVRQPLVQGVDLFSRNMGWSLLAIAVLIVLTIPMSHYPSLSAKKFFSRFLQQIFLTYLVTEIIYNRKRLYSVLLVMLLTLFFVTIDVMVQYTWGTSIVHHTSLIFGRVSGPMNHPNDLGTLLVTILPVTMILSLTVRSWMPLLLGKIIWQVLVWAAGFGIAALFILLLITLGLTDSRGAWIAFVVGIIAVGSCFKSYKLMAVIFLMFVIFFWVFSMHCLSTRIDLYAVPMVHCPVLIPSFTNPFGLPHQYSLSKFFFDSSDRYFYWGTALGVIKHSPWFGCGYNAYVQTLRDMHVGHEEYPHNSFLQITAELGVVGLFLYGWFFTALGLQINRLLRIIKHDRDLFLLGCGIASGILAWMVHSLMDTPWESYQLSVLWWMFIGVLFSLVNCLHNKGEKSWA